MKSHLALWALLLAPQPAFLNSFSFGVDFLLKITDTASESCPQGKTIEAYEDENFDGVQNADEPSLITRTFCAQEPGDGTRSEIQEITGKECPSSRGFTYAYVSDTSRMWETRVVRLYCAGEPSSDDTVTRLRATVFIDPACEETGRRTEFELYFDSNGNGRKDVDDSLIAQSKTCRER